MPIKIALTKGRVEQQVVPLLEASGIDCSGIRSKGRRLIFDEDPVYETILVKSRRFNISQQWRGAAWYRRERYFRRAT